MFVLRKRVDTSVSGHFSCWESINPFLRSGSIFGFFNSIDPERTIRLSDLFQQ
jgi:hypothetical protein